MSSSNHTNMITPNTCSEGTFHVNSTLQGGRNAGRFDYKGKMKTVLQCVTKCCNVRDCDLAYLDMRGSCYAVHCNSKELCKAVPAIGGESSSVFYVSREKHRTKGKHFSLLAVLSFWGFPLSNGELSPKIVSSFVHLDKTF